MKANEHIERVKRANVLILTLDSLRLDTAISVDTPNLDRIGEMRVAEASGSYTLPAHIALLANGNFPHPIDGLGKPLSLDRIWRSAQSRSRSLDIGIIFDGVSVPEHYSQQGFTVHGIGGVGFFNPAVSTNMLPAMIDHYWFPDIISPNQKLDDISLKFRVGQSCPITTRIIEFQKLISREDPWFVFCNVAETHFPYTVPGFGYDQYLLEVLTECWSMYPNKSLGSCKLDDDIVSLLKDTQASTLRFLDNRIGKIIDCLPKCRETLVIVCADHGEEFGEFGRFGHGHASESVWRVPLWVGLMSG